MMPLLVPGWFELIYLVHICHSQQIGKNKIRPWPNFSLGQVLRMLLNLPFLILDDLIEKVCIKTSVHETAHYAKNNDF